MAPMLLTFFISISCLLFISASQNRTEDSAPSFTDANSQIIEPISLLAPMDHPSPTIPTTFIIPTTIPTTPVLTKRFGTSKQAATEFHKKKEPLQPPFSDSTKTMVSKSAHGTQRIRSLPIILKDFLKKVDAAYKLSFQIAERTDEHSKIPYYMDVLTRAEKFYRETPAILDDLIKDLPLHKSLTEAMKTSNSKILLYRQAIRRFEKAQTDIYLENMMKFEEEIINDSFLNALTLP